MLGWLAVAISGTPLNEIDRRRVLTTHDYSEGELLLDARRGTNDCGWLSAWKDPRPGSSTHRRRWLTDQLTC